jgi:hypothetical protein
MNNDTPETTASGDTASPPIWYTENEMYQWLIRENYSEQIAKELSSKWADHLQGAFNKGFEKGARYREQIGGDTAKQGESKYGCPKCGSKKIIMFTPDDEA